MGVVAGVLLHAHTLFVAAFRWFPVDTATPDLSRKTETRLLEQLAPAFAFEPWH